MNIEAYPIKTVQPLIFTFVSVGRNGTFEMVIRYDPYNSDLYNLAFGVKTNNQFDIDDQIIINNGDFVRIIGTVFQTVPLFFEKYPEKLIIIMGSD